MKFSDLSEERQMEVVSCVLDAFMEIQEAGLPNPYKANHKISKKGREWVKELQAQGKEPSTEEIQCTIESMLNEGILQPTWSLQ
jgi:hypothetical protein